MDAKVAIVTGGASGIGKAIAQQLAQNKIQVIIADLNEEQGVKVAKDMGATFIQTDLSQQIACKNLIEKTIYQFGAVDILVNNAGFQYISSIEKFPEEKWNQLLSVMLTAPFLLMKYAWPGMKKKQWGRVINVASVHGIVASLFKSGYISAKHGMIGLTKTAALEGGPWGITVNAICPAYVRTPLVEKQIADQAKTNQIPESEVIEKILLKNAAIKRLIEPEEIGSMVLYLCSEAARSITGSSWTIDSGWTAQ
ncbi:MAG: D-beta-hydroxybutyrate dehydrogenase [SAR324 cluster bacterium]|uniref:D-beta-hydroxybutyrate dehydrogenase n=1 Tax=SAR324 cluster bacterium TaxID=2024889 RepID=A0A2A4SYN7_9DELT|nr:MAG: D-beta-hydroxybutyrate dehydrogenase [SAR324 cluster bacterium]